MITKRSLAKSVNKKFKANIDHKMAQEVVNFIFETITDELYASKKIKLQEFMTLYLDPVPERKFFHPQKQEWTMLPSRWKLVIKPSVRLNEKIKNKPCYLPSDSGKK